MSKPNPNKLFDRISENLRVCSDLQQKVRCPLCLKVFDRQSLEAIDPNKRLTVEHIIQKALGGDWCTLTCRICNNNAGPTTDAAFVKMINALNGKPLQGHVALNGNSFNSYVTQATGPDDAPLLKIVIPGGKPAALESLKVELTAPSEIAKALHVEFQLPFKKTEPQMALLRTAYLAAFDLFGYEYILTDAADVIRRVLIAEGKPPSGWESVVSFVNPVDDQQLFPFDGGIWPIEVAGRRVLLAVIRIAHGQMRYFTVVLPGHDVKRDDVWNCIREAASTLAANSPIKCPLPETKL